MTLTKTFTLRHERSIMLPSNVSATLNWEIPQGWHPDHDKEFRLVIRVEADNENDATLAFGDACAAFREAFGG